MGSSSDESVFMIVKYYGNTALKIVLTKPVHSKIWILNCNENKGNPWINYIMWFHKKYVILKLQREWFN